MKATARILKLLTAVFSVVLLTITAVGSSNAQADSLYVGDGSDNTVKQFDANTGVLLNTSQGPLYSGLAGPRGIVLDGDELLVVNQNVNLKLNGEVLRYNAATGDFLGRLIAATDKRAPFVPLGLVLGLNQDLFLGNLTTASGKSHGELLRYDSSDGAFLGAARATDFKNKDLHVRGVVIGPDNLVYASTRSLKKDGLGGAVLRYKENGSFLDVYINDDGGVGQLNRPEGLVFGPDGNLYITSFRASPADTDKVLIFQGPHGANPGAYVDQIDLDVVDQDRAFAQALLFGPGGFLFVPITGGPDRGAVRRYDVTTKAFSNFVPPGGSLGQGWYLTFGETDPGTLEYNP